MFLLRLYTVLRLARRLRRRDPPRPGRARRRADQDKRLTQIVTSLSQLSNLTVALWGGTIAASIAAFASALPYLFGETHCWATAISGAALYIVQSSIGWLCVLVIVPSVLRTLALSGSPARCTVLIGLWFLVVLTSLGVFVHVLENIRQSLTLLPDTIPDGMTRAKCSTWMLDQSFHPQISFGHSIRLLFYRGGS